MDAHEPVTLEEGDRYPLRPPSFEATPPGHFLARALGPATVASPIQESVLNTLSNLSVGSTATIESIVGGHSYTDRLKSMGFQTGQCIQVLRQTSHVMHVRVGTTEWAIRNQDAELVKIIP